MAMFLQDKGSLLLLLLILSLALNALLVFNRRGRARETGSGEQAGESVRPAARTGQPEEGSRDKFFPDGILSLLRVKSYGEISVGDPQYSSSVIMEINRADFSGFARGKQPDAVFSYINNMLSRIIPIIHENQGLVESFSEGGLTAFYLENRERALVAAVSVCEAMSRMSRDNQEYEAVTVGLCYGPLMIGAVGHEKRMTILILSESKEFARFLQSIGPRYHARLVAAASFMEAIPGWGKKFNCRLLGYVYLRASKTVEKIYDVFDGDPVEVRNRKRKTKMVFEKGVALFMEGRLPEARQHFIEVMKMDHGDKAAKEYLLRCDEYQNRRGGGMFMETY